MNFVAIDFETANNSEIGSICQIGAVKVCNNVIVDTYTALINPEVGFSESNIAVHGIRPADVDGAPTFLQAWPSFRTFIGDNMIVAHNASFDVSALEKAMFLAGISPVDFPYACSYCLAKQIFPNEEKYTLNSLCDKFRIYLDHHDALSDATACAKLVLIFSIIQGCDSLDHLLESCRVSGSSVLTNTYVPDEHISKANKWTMYAHQKDVVRNDFSDYELVQTDFFRNRTAVLTGNLRYLSRGAATSIIEELGGKCVGSVSKKTSVLIVGTQDSDLVKNGKSSKQMKAEELIQAGHHIMILDEWEFYKQLYGDVVYFLKVDAFGGTEDGLSVNL